MNKFRIYIIALFAVLFSMFSCNDDEDSAAAEVLRDYGTQYATESALIESYLKTHYIDEIINSPGAITDQDIIIKKIPELDATKTAIFDDARLFSKEVLLHGITYKLYYIKAREGDLANGEAPTRVDQVLVSYDGSYLQTESLVTDEIDPATGLPVVDPNTGLPKVIDVVTNMRFQYLQIPSGFFQLDLFITGWSEILPLFRSGTINSVIGQPTVYNDFGAGVMFIPSGLGYYNVATTLIPSYSSLMFSFKLFDVKRADQDEDGIVSINEDLNNDGIFTNDDSDGDGIQNYLDSDDDNDAYLTKNETQIPDSSPAAYYPYNPTDEQPLGVPNCSGDFTTPDRVRKYLDPSCH